VYMCTGECELACPTSEAAIYIIYMHMLTVLVQDADQAETL